MTELLTPEQVKEIKNRHFEAHNLPWIGPAVHSLGNAAHLHRGKLLRDREAICEKHIKLATEYRALEAKLAKVREYLDGSDVERSHYLNLIAILEDQS